jgi:hypothetical protein
MYRYCDVCAADEDPKVTVCIYTYIHINLLSSLKNLNIYIHIIYRYCDVCAAGEDPKVTVCEICSNTGGAYKALGMIIIETLIKYIIINVSFMNNYIMFTMIK